MTRIFSKEIADRMMARYYEIQQKNKHRPPTHSPHIIIKRADNGYLVIHAIDLENWMASDNKVKILDIPGNTIPEKYTHRKVSPDAKPNPYNALKADYIERGA